ncbi:MAG: penicillin-binding transpeptidase domain-containing protein [Anaeromassilibacillus sp.]
MRITTWATYDNDYKNQVLTNENHPLVNQAFTGIFTPGSCFKPAVACAALQEGVITNNTTFRCTHTYQRFADVGFTPRCLGTHGTLSLRRALAESCNIFFFETGYYTGIETMNLYCRRFGLGEKTGVELNESEGILAGPEEYAERGKTWVGATWCGRRRPERQQFTAPVGDLCIDHANNGVLPDPPRQRSQAMRARSCDGKRPG